MGSMWQLRSYINMQNKDILDTNLVMYTKDCSIFRIIMCNSGHVTGYKPCFNSNVPISLKHFVLDIQLKLFIDRHMDKIHLTE